MKIKVNKKVLISIISIFVISISVMNFNTLYADTYGTNSSKQINEIFEDDVVATQVAKSLGVDKEYYVSQIELNQITSLNIERSNVYSLEGLQNLTRLQVLQADVNNISDLSPIQNLTELNVLNIFQNNISDITVLSNLVSLREINIANNQIRDYSPLASLNGLQKLNISYNDNPNILPLQGMVSLTSFISDGNGISDISPIGSAINLTNLSLYENNIDDISPLTTLGSLQSLNLNNNPLEDITVLSNLMNLNTLLLDQTNITSLQPIENLSNLKKLTFSNTEVKEILPIRNILNLEHVEFNSTEISNLQPLSSLVNLTYLSFNSAKVSNIEAIAELKNLKDLHFNLNYVSDIQVLSNLSKLSTLWMSNNQLDNLESLTNINALKDLYFNGNYIQDISFLERMNTSRLSTINGANNQISDISPLSSISNQYIGIVFFDGQVKVLPDSTIQGDTLQVENVAVGLNNLPVQNFDILDATTITSTHTPLVNGELSEDAKYFSWNNLSAGVYTPVYSTRLNEKFKMIATLKYSLYVSQDSATIRDMLQIKYDGNGADRGMVPIDSAQYYDEDITTVLHHETLEKNNATFLHWNTEPDGSGQSFYANDDIILKEHTQEKNHVVLYAIWNDHVTTIITEKPKDKVTITVEYGALPSTGDNHDLQIFYIGVFAAFLSFACMKNRDMKAKKK